MKDKYKKIILGLWFISFLNLLIGEVITFALTEYIHRVIDSIGIWSIGLESLLAIILIIEMVSFITVLVNVIKGRIDNFQNILGALFALAFAIMLGLESPAYLVFSIIEAICLISLIVASAIPIYVNLKKSGFSL